MFSILFLGCANHLPATELAPAEKEQFSRSFYAGASLGFSMLEPNTSKINGWDVRDRIDNSAQISLGVDLSKQLSVEVHSADLGSAELSPGGRINYHIDGLSALVYAGGNRSRYKRKGLTAYGRGGFGLLSNSANSDVPYRRVDANQWLWGAGVEYMTATGFGARAEVISVSDDAQYGQLSLIYRFGKHQIEQTEQAPPKLVPKEKAYSSPYLAVAPPPPPPPAPPTILRKADTQQEAAVRCNSLNGLMDGVLFTSGSALLSSTAQTVLDEIAQILSKCPQVPVIISAHTDSQGSARTNQILSQRRAWAVINYLRSVDIDLYRLIPRAFGETKPIESNNTAEGRSYNRRVELIAR